MKHLLFILTLLIPVCSFGQHDRLEKLTEKMDHYRKSENYDSLIVACEDLLAENRIFAKAELADFYRADAYHELKEYEKSVKYGKRFLRRPATKYSRRGHRLMMYKRFICKNLYEMYQEQGDLKTAVSFLNKMDESYDVYWGGRERRFWKVKFYPIIIDYYKALGDQRHLAIYTAKLEALEN